MAKYRMDGFDIADTTARFTDVDMRRNVLQFAWCAWAQRSSPWWVGDLWLQLEERYGDDLWQFMPEGLSIDAVSRWSAVSRKVPRSIRRADLSWTHHAIVANLDVSDQAKLLQWAADCVVSSGEFRKVVSRFRKTGEM